jgi:hypothetical protein
LIEKTFTRQIEASIFAAFMCIERPETISCLKDHIALLKTILNRGDAHTLQIAISSQTNLQEIVCAMRNVLPDFVLNARILSVNEINFLPVVNLDPTSQPVIEFLQSQALSFPCMLQLLMLSTNFDEFINRLSPILDFIGTQFIQVGQNDVQYQLNLCEMFNILHAIFIKFKLKMHAFNDRISTLLTNSVVLDAFVSDPRFTNLTRGLRNDLKIAQMRQECQAYCAENGTTMAEAQRALGYIVFEECAVCIERSTPEFTTIFQCGHCLCTGCAEQISNCPTCRAKITCRTQADSIGIRFREYPMQFAEEPAEKRQRQEE